MEFCLALSHHPWIREADAVVSTADLLRAIQVADQAGLDSVWLTEDPDGWDAFSVLGAASQRTERIRLGSGVTNPYLRHPNLLAMSVATVDRLSNGRAFLGLGRGQPEWYRRGLGIATGRPPEVLSETISLLRQWWQPPHRATSAGHFPVRDWPRAVHPVQPHVPIYLAALGPLALDVAARQADGVLLAEFASLPFLDQVIRHTREAIVETGRDPATFAFLLKTEIEVTSTPERALDRRKNLLALVHTLPGMARHLAVPGYDVPEIIARVREVMRVDEVLARGGSFIDIREAGDFKAARRLIPTELVDQLSLVGTAERVRERLMLLQTIGITHVFIAPPRGLSAGEYAALIATLRPE
jgi:alkanesulfonate monooxygenase SsuD/methylene tetrahydromethanopterin reductase-like flavin-dependent oxidoreductase (luciferase family)